MEISSKRAHWEALIEDWKQSGKNQVSFCKEKGINHCTFSYWKKQLSPNNNLFVPIKVRAPQWSDSNFYKIETSLGVNIIIPRGADHEDLKVIFKSLGVIA